MIHSDHVHEGVAVSALFPRAPFRFKVKSRFAIGWQAYQVGLTLGHAGGLGRGRGRVVPVMVPGSTLNVDKVEIPGGHGEFDDHEPGKGEGAPIWSEKPSTDDASSRPLFDSGVIECCQYLDTIPF